MKKGLSIIDKFKEFSKQKIVYHYLISFLALFVVLYFIFFPGVRQFFSLGGELKEKIQTLNRVRIPKGEYDAFVEKKENVRTELDLIKRRLFWEKDIGKFLNELTQLASILPLEFVSLKPESAVYVVKKEDKKKDKKSALYTILEIPISAVLKGNYDSVLNFLKRIEQSDKFIKVDTFSIESDINNIYRHNVKIRLGIYVKED
ncbi:MAG: hypothetical protein NC912_06620 [Candidatus Omnitrophica bacterium]|nr:hypothetical protein [Candidatus Omnitrophota bacterium]